MLGRLVAIAFDLVVLFVDCSLVACLIVVGWCLFCWFSGFCGCFGFTSYCFVVILLFMVVVFWKFLVWMFMLALFWVCGCLNW